MTTATPLRALELDRFLDTYDFTRREELVIDAPPDEVYEQVRTLDFLSIHSPLMDVAMWVRTLPERLGRGETTKPPTMRLSDLLGTEPSPDQPWIALGEDPGREFVFGCVGKFWQADIEWNPDAALSFTDFVEPGWGKIAASISVHPYGTHRSIVVYEARTEMTDPSSRRRFGRYWKLVSPFVGLIMRALLDEVDRRSS